jgi:glycosyltransferase involved in cell wall biosynthesis
MRIGYVFNRNYIMGGGEISQLDLVDAVRDCGIDPVAVVPGTGEITEKLAALGVETALAEWPALRAAGLLRFPRTVIRTSRIFREKKLQLVHVDGARCMLYAGPAAGWGGIPSIWHVRVLDRDGMLDRFRAHFAHTVVANSGAVAAVLRPYLPARRRLEVIYNGFRLADLEKASPADLAGEFSLPPGPVILAVGRFCRWKGYGDLLRACAALDGEGVAFTCVLAGKARPDAPGEETELRALADELKLRSVVFAGWRPDVPSLMKSSTVLAVPSHGEPFGRIIPEAWACGLPVVAANSGGPAEIIQDGVTGLLVPTGDGAALAAALRRVLTDAGLRQKLAANGLKRSADFSLAGHAQSMAALYRSVLAC